MNRTNPLTSASRLFAVIALASTMLSMLLRSVNLLFFFDAEIGYYASGAILPVLADVITVLAVLFFGIAALTFLGKEPLSTCTASLARRIACVPVALAFLWRSVDALLSSSAILPFLLGLLASAYFILIAAGIASPLFRLFGCMGAAMSILLAMSELYFDITIPMNTPDKTVVQLACVLAVLFLVCDCRAVLANVRPRLYRFSLASATLLLGTASIPSLLGVLKLLLSETYLPLYLLLSALFVYTMIAMLELLIKPRTQADTPDSPTERTTD